MDTDAILDGLADAAAGDAGFAPPVPEPTDRRTTKPPRIRYTHEAMVDAVVANPSISQNDLAEIFGYTPTWISIVMNSDAFQAKLHERREELVDPTLRATLNEKMKALVDQSLNVLMNKVCRDPDEVSADLAVKTLGLASKALGMGAQQTTVAVIGADRIAALAERMQQFAARPQSPGEIIDAVVVRG